MAAECLLFPGQGVQRRGMGAGLFERHPELTEAADELLGYSIARLCLRDPERRLRSTAYAQPAIFLVNALLGIERLAEAGPGRYAFLAGHSLGEYNALVAGGQLDLLDGLRLVARRGELMAQVTGGVMMAVLGPPVRVLSRILEDADVPGVWIANHNADGQTVLAGERPAMDRLVAAITADGGARMVPLNTSGPFHTPLMAPAAEAMRELLRNTSFTPGHTPVLSSVDGEPFDPDRAADALATQVMAPVEWVRTVHNLRAAGVARFDEVNGTTLLTMIERIAA